MAKALFAIRDGSRRKAKPCAFLSYSDEEGFSIAIEPHVSSSEVPAFFVPFVKRGDYYLSPELSLRWVRERVPPPSRQNIGEILKAHGLNEYSELALLRSGRGESSQDAFVVEEVDGEITGNANINSPIKRREELGAEIKARRNSLEMSQRDLADAIGIDQPALSKIEAGKSNITFDILSSIDLELSNEERPLLGRTLHVLWNRQRRDIKNKLANYAPELGQIYCRLVNELETYDEDGKASIASSRVISHCFRELMDSFPAYVDGLALSGMQGPEKEALNDLFIFLDRHPLSKRSHDLVSAISTELFDALIKLQEAHLAGSGTNKQKMQVSVSGTKASETAPISAWEKAHRLAVQTAHLPQGKSARIPPYAEYHDNLVIVENSIQARIGNIYGVKGKLFDLIDKANRTDASGEFMPPRPEDIDSFISSVGDGTLQLLAFRELKNPHWLEALEKANFFDSYIGLDDSSVAPLHPAPFLYECLKFDRKRVISLLERMSAKGWGSTRSFMLETTIGLSDQELEPLSQEFIQWAKEGYAIGTSFWVHCNVNTLLVRMLQSNNAQLAKNGWALFQQLVRLRKRETDSYPYEEAVSCIPDYFYGQLIDEVMPTFPLKARLTISRNMLNQYTQPLDKSKPQLNSRIAAYSLSPEALEGIGFHKKLLVPWIKEYKSAVQDALKNDSDIVLHKILEQKPLVLRCIMSGLHEHIKAAGAEVLGETAQNALRQICFNEEALFEHEYEGEIILLLGDFAIHGNQDDRERFLHSFMGWLDSWERAKLKSVFPDSDESIMHEKRFMEHAILSTFPKESLPDYLQKRRQVLESEIGVYDGPRELYKVTTLWGPNSPFTVEEFMEKGSEQTLKWLNDWKPTEQDRFALIEYEGVARVLTALIEETPAFFDGYISQMKKQKLIYINGILGGWQNAIKATRDVPLHDIIDLCSFVLLAKSNNNLDATSGYEDEEEGLRAISRQMGWLFVELLKSTNIKLSEHQLHDILTILLEIREFALRNPQQDARWNNEKDQITASFNALCSISLSGIIQWLLRDEIKQTKDTEKAFEALNTALPDSDCLKPDVAAFALGLRNLLVNNQDWLEERYERLFGEKAPSGNQRLLLALQVSVFTTPPWLFDFLRPALETSIEVGMENYPTSKGIGRLNNYTESLGFNLFQLYVTGKIELNDKLLQQWFENAGVQAIGSALDEICYLVRSSPDTTDKIAYQIQLLWDYLADKPGAQSGILRGAFQLASSRYYEHDWLRKAIMEESKSHDSMLEMDMFFDDVLILASENPEWGIALLRSAIENDDEKNMYKYGKMPHALLGLYRDKFGKYDNNDVSYCMNELGRMGIFDLDLT